MAERGPWQTVVITCKTCLLQSMIGANVSGWPMLVVRMHLWKSSECHAHECRVLLLEVVRIGEARHMYSWGNLDGVNPDENVCHASSGDVCHVLSGGGVLTMSPFLTCSFCPSKNGRVKNNWFFETEFTFCAHWVTWQAGAKRNRIAFMMSRRLYVFPDSMSFQ